MSKIIFVLSFLFSAAVFATPLKASSTAKAFTGKNGELVKAVEVSDSKQILVYIEGIGGAWEGKTFLWNYEDLGERKNAFYEKKRGSKMIRMTPFVYRHGSWTIFAEGKGPDGIELRYSEEKSKGLKPEDIISLHK